MIKCRNSRPRQSRGISHNGLVEAETGYSYYNARIVDLPKDDAWASVPGSFSLAVHEKWDGLVTPRHPARPGEIVHVYATGLGMVDGPPPTGEATPTDRLVRLSFTPSCYTLSPDGIRRTELLVLFAGLAPGTLGHYLLSLRFPNELERPIVAFSCFTPTMVGGLLPVGR